MVVTRGLRRCFGSAVAVDGLDLTVAGGEIYGFLGPNGAGKSTVVRMLCTLLRPSGGKAVVAGFDVVEDPQAVRFRIGVALQEAALDDRQTGRELLTLQGRLYGMGRGEIRNRLTEVLDLVSIGDAIDRRIGTYSGGMKRRLDLAAALMHDPEIVFLDEPTTGLDPDSRAKVWAEVQRLNHERGITIFLTTQYLEEADVLAHRVGILSNGSLAAEGTPSALKRSVGRESIVADVADGDPELLERLRHCEVVEDVAMRGNQLTVKSANGASALFAVAAELGRSQVHVQGLSLRTPTLDDVYAAHTGSRLVAEGLHR